MNIIRLFFELFVLYIIYKLVFDFIIPIYNSTRHMKQKMTEMHHKMQQQQDSFNPTESPSADPKNSQKPRNEDYIEYEEIK